MLEIQDTSCQEYKCQLTNSAKNFIGKEGNWELDETSIKY